MKTHRWANDGSNKLWREVLRLLLWMFLMKMRGVLWLRLELFPVDSAVPNPRMEAFVLKPLLASPVYTIRVMATLEGAMVRL
jgi:hypothetical protein